MINFFFFSQHTSPLQPHWGPTLSLLPSTTHSAHSTALDAAPTSAHSEGRGEGKEDRAPWTMKFLLLTLQIRSVKRHLARLPSFTSSHACERFDSESDAQRDDPTTIGPNPNRISLYLKVHLESGPEGPGRKNLRNYIFTKKKKSLRNYCMNQVQVNQGNSRSKCTVDRAQSGIGDIQVVAWRVIHRGI